METTTKKPKKTEAQLRTEGIERMYANQTDRNLLEEQTFLMQKSTENLTSIRNNVKFFFWVFMVGVAIWLIVFFINRPNPYAY